MADVIKVNRAPVLTLWAATVAERLGFDWQEALTLGRAVAGLNAYSKGVSLGLYKPTPNTERERRRKAARDNSLRVDLLHRAIPAIQTPEGLRATSKGNPISPASVERYLESKFGERLDDVRAAMEQLARSRSSEEIAEQGYTLYERFRPQIPAGTRGWGVSGALDLDGIRSLMQSA